MQEMGRIIAINGSVADVVPVDIEMCIGCSNSECKNNGSVFQVDRGDHSDLGVGALVRVRARSVNQLGQGLFAIGLPIAGMAAGYAVVSARWPEAGEGLRVLGGLVLLACTTVAVIIRRMTRKPALPYIEGPWHPDGLDLSQSLEQDGEG